MIKRLRAHVATAPLLLALFVLVSYGHLWSHILELAPGSPQTIAFSTVENARTEVAKRGTIHSEECEFCQTLRISSPEATKHDCVLGVLRESAPLATTHPRHAPLSNQDSSRAPPATA